MPVSAKSFCPIYLQNRNQATPAGVSPAYPQPTKNRVLSREHTRATHFTSANLPALSQQQLASLTATPGQGLPKIPPLSSAAPVPADSARAAGRQIKGYHSRAAQQGVLLPPMGSYRGALAAVQAPKDGISAVSVVQVTRMQ